MHKTNAKLMKQLLLSALLIFISSVMHAQENGLATLRIEARLDYMQEYRQGEVMNDNTGFKGRYLNIRMDGNISEHFSYSYRQRLNKPNKDISFFDATDWIHLTYTNRNWSVSAGKQVVGIGGYEYDVAPIDLYIYSEYWGNIPCFRVGVSGTYTTDDKKDKFLLQFCESPFRGHELNVSNEQMFAYNAMWYGSHGIYSSIWSVNMLEYLPGKFMNYIALGNRLTLGQFQLDLDIMNRAVSTRDFLGKDMSIMSKFMWKPSDRFNMFLIATHDFNHSDDIGDWSVLPGTEITRVGGGIEYFPLKKSQDIRLHLACSYTDGVNSSPAGLLHPHQTIIDAGVTWKMDLLKIKR